MELQLNLLQPFRAYNHFAFEYGILLLHEENYTYFYTHTIEMIAYVEIHGNIVFLPKEEILGDRSQPLLMCLYTCLNRSLPDNDNFQLCVSEIKYRLDQGMYLYENFDEFYIPHRFFYKKDHYIHNFLINGYDDENFFVWGYTDRDQLEKVLIPYRNVYDALMAVTYKDRQRFVCINQNFHYELNTKEIRRGIINYLAGNSAYDFGEGTECGIDFIRFLINDLNGNLEHFDFRYYRTVKEHKYAMRDRIKWLFDRLKKQDDSILSLADEICKFANLSFIWLLKFRLTQQSVARDKAIEMLNRVIELERICYIRLLELL